MSVNTLWTLITNYSMEGHSQQVNLEANGQFGKSTKFNILHWHPIRSYSSDDPQTKSQPDKGN